MLVNNQWLCWSLVSWPSYQRTKYTSLFVPTLLKHHWNIFGILLNHGPKYILNLQHCLYFFLAVRNSSIGDLVPWSVCPLESSQHYRVTPETCDLWDIWSEWWGDMTWLKKTYLPTYIPNHLPTFLTFLNFFSIFFSTFSQLCSTFFNF